MEDPFLNKITMSHAEMSANSTLPDHGQDCFVHATDSMTITVRTSGTRPVSEHLQERTATSSQPKVKSRRNKQSSRSTINHSATLVNQRIVLALAGSLVWRRALSVQHDPIVSELKARLRTYEPRANVLLAISAAQKKMASMCNLPPTRTADEWRLESMRFSQDLVAELRGTGRGCHEEFSPEMHALMSRM